MMFSSVGYAICFGVGAGLPQVDYNPAISIKNNQDNNNAYKAFKKDEFWDWIIFFPIFGNICMVFFFLMFIRSDSIMHSIK